MITVLITCIISVNNTSTFSFGINEVLQQQNKLNGTDDQMKNNTLGDMLL